MLWCIYFGETVLNLHFLIAQLDFLQRQHLRLLHDTGLLEQTCLVHEPGLVQQRQVRLLHLLGGVPDDLELLALKGSAREIGVLVVIGCFADIR